MPALPSSRTALLRPARASLLAVLLGSTACYTYHPVEAPRPISGERVRMELSGAGRDRIRETNGVDLPELSGTVLDADRDAVTLEVRLDGRRLGYGSAMFIDTLQVARADTRDIGVRTLSTPRTILAVAGGVAAVAGAFALFKSDASGLPGDDPGEVIEPITLIRTLGALLGLGR
ncbi:MAG: hypothetical protein R3E98_09230 [Gemmatimonadota bacterium]